MLLSRLTLLLLFTVLMVVMDFGTGFHSEGFRPPVAIAAEPPKAPAVEPFAKPPAGYHNVPLNGHTFTLPDGFTIELAAGPTLAERPVSAAFDDKGRLYVTDSSGDNSKAPEQAKTKTHRIRRLEDTNGDGTFDKSTLFVKNVAMPQGAMFYKGSLYVAAPPSIMKFTDTDDDGIADKEEVWFDGKTVGNCGNDVHGPWIGPDGWFYWTKGGFEKQEYTLPTGKKWSTRAAHVFRAKPDGTNLEPIMTGGMDNPVGLTFTTTGEVLVCGTFFQHPADGNRDGIIHAVYGGVFGKDHSPIYEHPWTSPSVLPIMTHLGPAAACALTRYQSDQFGKDYVDNVFCCQFNLRKVSRHVLAPEGATYKTIDSDFVVSNNLDFHPTDVIEDADGSLLIIDTGGWYKLCCPTSQLVKTDVTGAIYRVRKIGMHTKRVERATPGVLILRQIGGETFLKSPDPHVVRQTVKSLGQEGRSEAIPAILEVIARSPDRFLDHACTFALIEIGDVKTLTHHLATGGRKPPEPVGSGTSSASSPPVRRALITALDQIPDGKLDTKFVLAELDSPDAALKETAWWIAGRHPEWGEQLAGRFAEQLKSAHTLTPSARDELAERILKFVKHEAVQKTLGEAATQSIDAHRLVLHVMARSGLKSLPKAWKNKLALALTDIPGQAVDAFAVLRAIPPSPEDYSEITRRAFNILGEVGGVPKERVPAYRLGLASSIPPGNPASPETFDFLIQKVGRDEPGETRALAVEGLLRAGLTAEQFASLSTALKTTTPIDFAKLLPTFATSKEPEVGLALVAALSDLTVRKLVRQEQVKPMLDKYPAAVRVEAEKLYVFLAEDRKAERTKLDALIAQAPKGDERRGQVVFNSAKAACIACHKIGYVGGNVGPDLRRIGAVRTERDLMEAIVFPSASFVRSYEPFRVVTTTGKVYNGILRKDAPEEVILAVAADQEVRIPRADVEETTPSTVSVMPAGLDQQLSPQDLADLVAFLKANVR